MKRFLCLVLASVLLCLGTGTVFAASASVSELQDATFYEGHYYKYYDLRYNWDAAKAHCESVGGHLVTIANAQENAFVYNLCGQRQIWLGASDAAEEGVFRWVTGEPFSYTYWHSGEPNNDNGTQDYLQMYRGQAWDDTWPNGTQGFVCEWDVACVSDAGVFLDHTWSEATVLVPATCEKDGEATHTCLHCGKEEPLVLSALGHKYGEVTVLQGNVLIPPIVKERTCQRCEYVDHIEDWSYVWVTVLAGVGVLALIVGVIGYVRAFRKRS